MFAKRFLMTMIIVLLGLGEAACTLKLNEESPKTELMAVSPVDDGCLTNAGEVLNRFFLGAVSEQELGGFWDCLYKSFEMFLENTRGKSDSHYTPDELALFLEKYFLKGKKLPPSLIAEAMLLKHAIVGGSTGSVTKSELRGTLNLIRTFKEQTLRVRPFMPFDLETILAAKTTDDHFDEVASVFHSAMEEIGRSFSRSTETYSFTSMEALLRELGIYLYGSNYTENWLGRAGKYIGIVKATKSILIGPPENQLNKTDWLRIFRLVPRYYTLYLRYSLYFSDEKESKMTGKGLRHLSRFAETLRENLLESIEYHPAQKISFDELNRLARALEDQALLPVKSSTVEALLLSVAARVFRNLENPVPSDGINKAVVDGLFDRYLTWSEGQFYLEGVFRHFLGEQFLSKPLSAKQILSISETESLRFTQHRNEISLAAIREVRRNLLDERLFYPPGLDYVVIPKHGVAPELMLTYLSTLNWLRTAVRTVIQGYATEPDRDRQILSREETMVFYNDILPAVIDLGFFESFNKEAVINRLMEADLFLPSADGDGHLSYNEATELLTLLISSWKRSDVIHDFLASKCKVPKDVPDRPVDTSCYRNKLAEEISELWNFVPGIVGYLKNQPKDYSDSSTLRPVEQPKSDESMPSVSISKASRTNFIHVIDTIVRKTDDVWNQPIRQGDTLGMTLLLYYIEALFHRYDMDDSGTISKQEARRAYPVFRGFLVEKTSRFGLNSEEDYEAVFHFLLKYQKLPNENFLNKVRYFRERYLWKTSYEIDRTGIAIIFSRLLEL